MKSKKLLCFVLTVCLMLSLSLPVLASTQEKISDAKSSKEEAESSLDDTKNRIDSLQSKKGESEEYLSELNAQLETLEDSLKQLDQDSKDKQEELDKVQAELEETKKLEEKQYEDMKLRIQFMYEKSSGNYLEMLLSSDSFSEFINRADHISQISEYDRDMLKEYQKTLDTIKEAEQRVKEEKAAIVALQEESIAKQGEVEEVVASTYNQISEYATQIDDAQSEEAILLSKISAQESTINGLLKQAKEEEIAAQKQAKAKEKAAEEVKEAETTQQQESTSEESGEVEVVEEDSSNEDSSSEDSQPEEDTPAASAGGSGTYLGTFKATAYCSCSTCCGGWAGGATASGTTPTPGRTVAMGGVPFGTKLMINGTVYTVEDRGTAYGHVDIFMGSHSAALGFGLQQVEVYQLG